MEDLNGEAGVLAVLDELAEMRKPVLLGLRVLLDHGDDRVSDTSLVKILITNKKFPRFIDLYTNAYS